MPHEHPSPLPSYLPRLRLFEVHDLPFTPYILNFMTTRVLEFGWSTDIAFLAKPILSVLLTILGKQELYEERFCRGRNTSLCFADSIAELLYECFEKIDAQQEQEKGKRNTTTSRRILDLCVGAGGPSFKAAKTLSEMYSDDNKGNTLVHLTVSDLVPHPRHWKPKCVSSSKNLKIDYEEKSVDATKVQLGVAKNAIWTIYGAFHHFEEENAKKFLQSAADNDDCSGVLIVELAEHRLSTALLLLPAGVILTLLLPFYIIQPLSKIPENIVFFAKVLFFLPLLCFTMMWDSTISCARTLTTQELLELAKKADPESKMEWHAAVRDFVPGLPSFLAPGIVYLRGVKKALKK